VSGDKSRLAREVVREKGGLSRKVWRGRHKVGDFGTAAGSNVVGY